MKKILIIIAFVSMVTNALAKKNYTVKELLSYFKEIKQPFTTKQLYSTYSELPYDISLKYFFKNDTAFSYYYYQVENGEDFTIMESGYRKKKIFPCNHFYVNNYLLLVYELIDEAEDPSVFLSVWDKAGKQIDSLIIAYQTASAPESYNTIKSKIYADSVVVFDYKLTDYDEIYKLEGVKTVITVTRYAIDTKNGKFVETCTDEIKSKYDLYLFDEGTKEEIKQEDPYYKY
jgi:hypothetical protein